MANVATPRGELVVDFRGRANLQRFTRGHSRYLVEVKPDGTIVLTPAVTITAAEAEALKARTENEPWD